MQISIFRGMAAMLIAGSVVLVGCGGGAKAPAASTPAATTAASTYAREANATLTALAAGASGVADVLAKPDPAAATWRTTLNGKLDALAQVDAQARALRPGTTDAEVHQRLLEITADFNRVAQLLRSSVDPVNADGLAEAAQLLGAGVARVAVLRAALPQS